MGSVYNTMYRSISRSLSVVEARGNTKQKAFFHKLSHNRSPRSIFCLLVSFVFVTAFAGAHAFSLPGVSYIPLHSSCSLCTSLFAGGTVAGTCWSGAWCLVQRPAHSGQSLVVFELRVCLSTPHAQSHSKADGYSIPLWVYLVNSFFGLFSQSKSV